ncbi:MAG: S9 family peptidase [Gemmatimonadetes bacterium]|nr:S9 family peptidase [Gemmatimonadota bacterium]
MTRGWMIAMVVAAGPTSVAGQSQRPFTVDEFLRLKIAGDPQVSPDGSMVAFTVTVPSLSDNRNVSRIWVHSLTEGISRELTGGPGSDQSPRWAKDGRTLAFLSTRSGAPQVWRIRTDGGEPRQMTNLPTGVNQFVWSPDTTALFVTSDVKWPAATELDRRHGDYPTAATLVTGLFYRHWNQWRAGVRTHLFRVDAAGQASDITPIDRDVPTLALGGEDIAISPVGTELAVVFNPDSVVATSTNNEIFLVGPDGAGLVPMTNQPGNDHSPIYSPNARWIAYLSMATAGFEADRQQLMLYDRASGDRRSLTADWDASIGAVTWLPDSRSVIVEVEERGERNLYRIPVPAGPRIRLTSGGVHTAARPTPIGDGIIYLRQSATRPPELYQLKFTGGSPVQLTTLNGAALAGFDLRPLERFAFLGAKGDSVHGWLMKPPAFDSTRRYPVAYLIHGGPQSAWLDQWHLRWNYALFAARGYLVAAVNFHGSTGYGQAFTNSISRNWGGLPAEDLIKGLDHLARLRFVDAGRIGAAGASYGGYMVYWLAGQTDRFKALVAHDGIYNTTSMAGTTEELWFTNWEFGGPVSSPEARSLLEQWSPANQVAQWKTPLLVVHGQLDYRVDVSEGLQAYTAAQTKGLPSKLLYFPDEGHFVLKPRNRRLWWGVVLDWLDQHLATGQAAGTPAGRP